MKYKTIEIRSPQRNIINTKLDFKHYPGLKNQKYSKDNSLEGKSVTQINILGYRETDRSYPTTKRNREQISIENVDNDSTHKAFNNSMS